MSYCFKGWKKEGDTVEDLIAANPGVDPSKLKVGQTIKFGSAQNSYTPKPETPKKINQNINILYWNT
ncbi:LysM peptidoglycan-binding domain-containing protein [Bacillus megaterium]|nr:LysM peptidoglycan-binding domain-containing protein [Priestia megaterium]